MLALRRQRPVEDGRDADVGERCRGRVPGDGVLECVLDVVEARREDDRAAVDVRVEPRRGAELGEPIQCKVDLDGAAAGLPPPDVGEEVIGQVGRVELLEERDLRVSGGHHGVGEDLLT